RLRAPKKEASDVGKQMRDTLKREAPLLEVELVGTKMVGGHAWQQVVAHERYEVLLHPRRRLLLTLHVARRLDVALLPARRRVGDGHFDLRRFHAGEGPQLPARRLVVGSEEARDAPIPEPADEPVALAAFPANHPLRQMRHVVSPPFGPRSTEQCRAARSVA